MNETCICEPITTQDLIGLTQVRELAAVVAYSRPGGPTEDEVRLHYSNESDAIISKIINKEFNARTVRIGETVVAMCVWSHKNGKARIDYLYSHPEHQGVGYGSMLIQTALAELSGLEIELTTQNAQGFYEKWGFERTGVYVTDEITSEEIMVRNTIKL